MSVYIVSRVDISDMETMSGYMAAAPETVAAHGGRYIVRTANIEKLEGETSCDRVVVLEFPTREQALDWYNSQDYRPLRDIRWQAAKASILLVE
ncbi:Uncharacterized conserved protein, DUF1330 family [Rhizobiales bacterium GAS191]|jgi:uncharacterized protein (DUF1330 family)|nr:Uncharacterized conserved protein, DUF1330 family [Rhizobiales bacterium GAS188]SEE65725.1 Uncharacterized conserved protein, DUF1330 family [Rhizobiales bacterium GAS191]